MAKAGACSKLIMYGVNALLLLLGIAVGGIAVAAKVNRGAIVDQFPQYADAVPSTNINLAMVAGLFIFVVAILGIVGACCYDSCAGTLFLVVYIVVILIAMLIEIVAIATLFLLSGALSNYADKSPAAYDQFETKVNKFTNQTFNKCCSNGAVATNVEGCSLLTAFVTADSCKTPAAFRNAFVDYVKKNLTMVGAFCIVLALVQMVVMYAACCMCCKSGKPKKADAETGEANPGYQKQGGDANRVPAAGSNIAYA